MKRRVAAYCKGIMNMNYNQRQKCWEGYLFFSPLPPHLPLSKLLLTQPLNLHCILYGRL